MSYNLMTKKINKQILAILCVFQMASLSSVFSMDLPEKQDLPKEIKIERIWGLYKKYCEILGKKELEIKRRYYEDPSLQLHPYYDGAWGSCMDEVNALGEQIGEGEQYPEALNNLDVNLSWNEIEDVFNKYGVIQLRKIDGDSHKLLLGCGNYPIDEGFRDWGHFHKGMTTINPEITKNPTIIAAFGIDDLTNLLPEKQYNTLVFEFFGNLKKTDELVKALEAPYFSQPLDNFYHVEDALCNGGRGAVKRDIDGYDVIYPFSKGKESLFEKKGLPDTESSDSTEDF